MIQRERNGLLTLTVPRDDVTTEQVGEVLRRRLGPRYNVLPGVAVNWNPVGRPRSNHPDTVVVGTGSTRVFRAQVKVSHHSGQTTLHVSPGGLTATLRPFNRLWIARKVLDALQAEPSLR
jgi:hypothetical protein